jgi:hypothetical protein
MKLHTELKNIEYQLEINNMELINHFLDGEYVVEIGEVPFKVKNELEPNTPIEDYKLMYQCEIGDYILSHSTMSGLLRQMVTLLGVQYMLKKQIVSELRN